MKKNYTIIPILLATAFCWSSCTKKNDSDIALDDNRITMVIADNFNLSSFSAALRRSGMERELKTPGAFTVLAASDAAFAAAGYPDANSVLTADQATVIRLAKYHTLDGKYELNKLPYLFNQELRSRGGKIYATHWIKGADTVITINGARVLSGNIPASNGLVQVIDNVLSPYIHERMGNAIAAEPTITLFTQALVTAGMLDVINSNGPYTVFAPDNAAMNALGYETVQQISEMDPQALKQLVSYHIVRNRRFIFDYILSTGASNLGRQTMMDGNVVSIALVENPLEPGKFSSIALTGTGNALPASIQKRDILAGNGVLHVISSVLKVTQ